MTLSTLLKELGVSSATVNAFQREGLPGIENIFSGSRELTDDEVSRLRKYCLFRMLGYSFRDTLKLSQTHSESGNTFKESLAGHVKAILDDASNNTQAAIVLQNIKRNEESFDDFDPVPYIEHISELRARGGAFYDVNTGMLPMNAGSWNTVNDSFPKPDVNASRPGANSPKWSTDTSSQIYNAEEVYKRNHSEKSGNTVADSNDDSLENNDSESADACNDSDTTSETDNGQNSENSNPFMKNSTNYFGSYSSGVFGSGNAYGKAIPNYNSGGDEVSAEGIKICPHPIRRYLARTLDQALITLLLDLFLTFVLHINIGTSIFAEYAELFASFIISCLIEPFLLASVGYTPGKFILGIKITKRGEGRKLTLQEAGTRTFKMARYGLGFMIPLYGLIKEIKSYQLCSFGQVLQWDDDCDAELTTQSYLALAIYFVILFLVVNFSSVISYQSLIPTNRGNLNTEQFYANCSQVLVRLGYATDPATMGYSFNFDSAGNINSVTYEFTGTADNVNIPAVPLYTAFMAFAGAADGSNAFTLYNCSALSKVSSPSTSFVDSYCGINIENMVEISGYSYQNLGISAGYVKTDANGSVHVKFTLTRH